MPQQLLDMLNNGEDIGALWEGILAELAVGRGFDRGHQEEAPEAGQDRDGEVENLPERMPGGRDPPEPDEPEEDEEDEEFQDAEGGEEEEEVRRTSHYLFCTSD